MSQDTPAARFMKKITSKYYCRDTVTRRDVLFGQGFVSYDSYAMAAAIDCSVVTESVLCPVRVELQGALCRGMMALDQNHTLGKQHCVVVMTACDTEKLATLLMTALDQPRGGGA